MRVCKSCTVVVALENDFAEFQTILWFQIWLMQCHLLVAKIRMVSDSVGTFEVSCHLLYVQHLGQATSWWSSWGAMRSNLSETSWSLWHKWVTKYQLRDIISALGSQIKLQHSHNYQVGSSFMLTKSQGEMWSDTRYHLQLKDRNTYT